MNTSKLSLVRMYISHFMIGAPLWVRNFAEAFRCLHVSLPAFFNLAVTKGKSKDCRGVARVQLLSLNESPMRHAVLYNGRNNLWIPQHWSPKHFARKADQAEHIQNYFKQTKIKLDNGRKVVVTCFRNAFCVAASKTRPKLPLGWRTEIFD